MMNILFLCVISIIGLSGITAQVIILRELLVNFYGNELSLGVILGNWVILEALGVFFAGKYFDTVKDRKKAFVVLEIVFLFSFYLSLFFARIFKSCLGIPQGEGLGILTIFFISLLILLPVSLIHGALFSAVSKLYSSFLNEERKAIGKTYAWETFGTIAGGILLTYFFVPFMDSFTILFFILLANIFACFAITKFKFSLFNFLIVLITLFFASFMFIRGNQFLEKASLDKQWENLDIIDYRNSHYGNLAVAEKNLQKTIYYNGLPEIIIAYPDMVFAQNFANLSLLFSRNPKEILLLESGLGGLLHEITKHQIKNVYYTQLDPAVIELAKKYAGPIIKEELMDPKIKMIISDGRVFLKEINLKFDVIIVGIGKPNSLLVNRYFTDEFFRLAKDKLKPGGLVSIYLPGSLSYYSDSLRDLNACILNAMRKNFAYLRIIPGDYNIILASDEASIKDLSATAIESRREERNLKSGFLVPAYLEYRLDEQWRSWLDKNLQGSTRMVNSDFHPIALFEYISLWNDQFSIKFSHFFKNFKKISLKFLIGIIFSVSVLLILYSRLKLKKNIKLVYVIFSTGFYGMMTNLILIFIYQVLYGSLYYKIGLLISVFMSGIAIGSIISLKCSKIRILPWFLLATEGIIIGYLIILGRIINYASFYGNFPESVFYLFIIICGILVGFEFPLAASIYSQPKGRVAWISGVLYSSDLIGAWVAGLTAGIFFLPILGISKSFIFLLAMKLSSFLVYSTGYRNKA